MGTRSNTVVYDEGVQILNMYRQMDGYPEGHGAELLAFLEPITMVNGLSGDRGCIANGAGCLAALMISHFKTEAGGIYIQPPMVRGEHENDFTYTIIAGGDYSVWLMVHEYGEEIFDGPLDRYKKFIEGYTS